MSDCHKVTRAKKYTIQHTIYKLELKFFVKISLNRTLGNKIAYSNLGSIVC